MITICNIIVILDKVQLFFSTKSCYDKVMKICSHLICRFMGHNMLAPFTAGWQIDMGPLVIEKAEVRDLSYIRC